MPHLDRVHNLRRSHPAKTTNTPESHRRRLRQSLSAGQKLRRATLKRSCVVARFHLGAAPFGCVSPSSPSVLAGMSSAFARNELCARLCTAGMRVSCGRRGRSRRQLRKQAGRVAEQQTVSGNSSPARAVPLAERAERGDALETGETVECGC